MYDLIGNRSRAFMVDRTEHHRRAEIHAESATKAENAIVSALHAYFVDTRGAMRSLLTVEAPTLSPHFDNVSAFDVVVDANLRAQLGDRLAQGRFGGPAGASWNRLKEVTDQHAAAYVGFPPMQNDVAVTFADGTKAAFETGLRAYDGHYIEESARSSEGNLIPEANSVSFAGTYAFESDADRLRFHQTMQLLGAEMRISNATGKAYKCAWHSLKKTLRCDKA